MKKINFLLLFCLLSTLTAYSQVSRFSAEKYISGNGDTLNYRLLRPESQQKQKNPLVIFMHGSGERGNDNTKQLKWGVENFATDRMLIAHPAYVIAPQCPAGQSWSNVDRKPGTTAMQLKQDPSKPMQLLIALVKEFVGKNQVDTSRIYITGLSMGGFGTFDALERYPGLFAAGVPVCGGGDTTRVRQFAKIPVWIFHGTDDNVVSPLCSKDMAEALVRAGARPGLTFYPGVGHSSWIGAYSDQTMLDWLFSQHK